MARLVMISATPGMRGAEQLVLDRQRLQVQRLRGGEIAAVVLSSCAAEEAESKLDGSARAAQHAA